MARRRLTPTPLASDVPRAEQALEAKALSRLSPGAPIAQVAAEAASTAALRALAEDVEAARATGRMVVELPLDRIAPDHLTRDRIPHENEEMVALRASIAAHGQRVPIEVTPLDGALPYGLISGWRRLEALKRLHAETDDPRFSTVRALVRPTATAADAYVAMVEENELRVGLSQYERARVAALAAERGIFPDVEAALSALFGTASRAKRSRIRAFLEIYRALDGLLAFPTHLPERLGLKLVAVIRAGERSVIVDRLAAHPRETPEQELALLTDITRPLPSPHKAEEPVRLAPDLTARIRRRQGSLSLSLRGAGVTPELEQRLRTLLDQLVPR